jgi:hypothetical protein
MPLLLPTTSAVWFPPSTVQVSVAKFSLAAATHIQPATHRMVVLDRCHASRGVPLVTALDNPCPGLATGWEQTLGCEEDLETWKALP